METHRAGAVGDTRFSNARANLQVFAVSHRQSIQALFSQLEANKVHQFGRRILNDDTCSRILRVKEAIYEGKVQADRVLGALASGRFQAGKSTQAYKLCV